MTREEFAVLAASMKAVYTDPKFLPDKTAMEVWYMMLRHLEYKRAAAAVQAHMMTNRFPPTPADINLLCCPPPEMLSPDEAWAMVWRAICDSAYHSRERFEEFPDEVKRAVGSPDNLRTIGMSEYTSPGAEKKHFMESYRVICQRITQEAQIPLSVRQVIKMMPATQEKKALEVKDDGDAGA